MQLSTGILNLHTEGVYKEVPFMLEEDDLKLLQRACSGDVGARLQLVKRHLSLVVELAACCSAETGKPFLQMVQSGALAVVKAADEFDRSQKVAFDDYVKSEITRVIGNYYN